MATTAIFDAMAEDTPEAQALPPSPFNPRQQRFIELFCAGRNCTQAAKGAGYSEDCAYSQGSRLLKNAEIRAAIDERLTTLSLGAAEVTKLTSEIAQSNINEFLTVEEVEQKTWVNQPLLDAISATQTEIAFEEEYALRAKLEEDELEDHRYKQRKRRRQIIRWELELEATPEATRSIEGPKKLVKQARLDLVRLAESSEGGRIKSLSYGEFGPKVELYAADAALDKLARMHGLYEKDNKQLGGTEVIIIGGGSGTEAD